MQFRNCTCAKKEFSLRPPILELYRTILELYKGNGELINFVRKVGIDLDKVGISYFAQGMSWTISKFHRSWLRNGQKGHQ